MGKRGRKWGVARTVCRVLPCPSPRRTAVGNGGPAQKDGVAKNPQRLRPSPPNHQNSLQGANPALPSLPVSQSTLQRPGCSPGDGD